MLLKIKLQTSTSFRALSISSSIYFHTTELSTKSPTHTTLINWIHKIGYHELTKKKEKASDWIVIPDESIQLGNDKVLVIYGIREKNIQFKRPLKFQDLEPLRIVSKKSFNGEIIKNILTDLQKDFGKIKYAVGDYGSDIRKGLRLSGIPHVHDLTHKIALLIEKIYKDKKEYIEITKKMSKMRTKYSQTKNADIIPPKQRTKSRYQNIGIISDWCIKSLKYIERCTMKKDRVYICLKWLVPYKEFIEELSDLHKNICRIEKELKHFGFSDKTKRTCVEIVKTLCSDSGKRFANGLLTYFEETKRLLPKTKRCLITSDIIESAFGKYKNYVSLNPMAGITNLTLCLAAFTSSLKPVEIKKVLENTKIDDIKKWTEKNIGKTLLQRRKALLTKG